MPFKPTTYADERRVKFPGRGLAMDYGNSKTTAIEEFCRGCLQSQTAADCTARDCPLFPFRPGADAPGATQRRPGIDVPTEAEYQASIEAKRQDNPNGVEALQAWRDEQKAAKLDQDGWARG